MRTLLLVTALLCASAVRAAGVEPLFIVSHVSDPTDGGKSDQTTDFVGAGLTVRLRSMLEIDLALGRQARDCGALFGDPCPARWGGMIVTRMHPHFFSRGRR